MTFLQKSLRTPAVENCTNCGGAASSSVQTSQEAMPEGFTYNDGGGARDTVRIYGPLSEAFRQALQIKFESTGVANLSDALDVDRTLEKVGQVEDNLTPATESQAQDAHVDAILSELAKTPGADVVLPNFNYEMVKQHVAKFENTGKEGEPKLRQEDIPGGVVPLYVSDLEHLESVRALQDAHSSPTNILVVSDYTKPAVPGEHNDYDSEYVLVTGDDKSQAFKLETEPQITEGDVQMLSMMDRVTALESAYRNSGSKLFFSLESFVAHMAHRLMARRKDQ